jgi:DNA-binding transcriptional regulator YiaG
MKTELFEELVKSIKEAGEISQKRAKPSRVFKVDAPDVKGIREKTGLSQAEFSKLIRVNLRTLQNWEQHRRTPTGPAAVLLAIVAKEPEMAVRAIHGKN